VSSAILLARARGEGPSSAARLFSAFAGFDEERADRLLEESLALRSVERTVVEVLLAAVAAHLVDSKPETPEYEFAWRHATGWLSAQKRLAAPASRDQAVLIFDATLPFDFDAVQVHALELVLRRFGLRTLSLTPSPNPTRLGRAVRAFTPTAVVLTGQRAKLQVLARVVHLVRTVGRETLVCDYRNALPDTGAVTVCRLGESVIAARDRLVDRLDAQARPAQGSAGLRPRAATACM